jgi:hypothetical protein
MHNQHQYRDGLTVSALTGIKKHTSMNGSGAIKGSFVPFLLRNKVFSICFLFKMNKKGMLIAPLMNGTSK